jgi:hypothetical protein
MNAKRRTIIRAAHNEQPYFMMLRDVAQVTTLSYEALGMLCYLLSKPNDWEIHPEALAREHCGRDKAYRLLAELKKAGHIERQMIKDERNRIVRVEYLVHEKPLPEKPYTEKPDTEFPDTEKPHITEYREEQSKERGAPAPVELPDHVPMSARITTGPAQPDGGAMVYSIIEAFCDGWEINVAKYRNNLHTTNRKAAQQLADLGAKPDEVRAMIAERRALGRQMEDFPLIFAARDYVAWKSSQAKPTVVVDEKTAWRASQKARPNVLYDEAVDMLLPAFKDEDDRRRYITEYLNMTYAPRVQECAS